MKRQGKKSRLRRIIDTGIYCLAVICLFFAVILFMQDFEYQPTEVYQDPPPPPPASVQTPSSTYTPQATPTPSLPVYPTPSQNASSPTAEPTAEATATATEAPWYDEDMLRPVKLYFVDQKVSCDVLPVHIKNNKMDTIRSAHKAGWLYAEPYVLPGETGKAIIAGHNRWGGKAGVFSVIKKMSPGEQVAVEMTDGYARYFTVDEIFECSYDDNSVMEAVYDRAVLVLITCKGDWSDELHTSQTRIVAICSPIS